MKRALIPLLLLCVAPTGSFGADWSGCASDLDTLSRAARNAEYAAQELENANYDLENCLSYPDLYDLLDDECSSRRWDVQAAEDALSSELWTVGRKIRSVQWSCDYEFSLSNPAYHRVTPKDEWCATLNSFKGEYSVATILQVCKRSRSETDCRKCLKIP